MTPLSLSLWVYGIVWDAFQQFLKYQQQKPIHQAMCQFCCGWTSHPCLMGKLLLKSVFFIPHLAFSFPRSSFTHVLNCACSQTCWYQECHKNSLRYLCWIHPEAGTLHPSPLTYHKTMCFPLLILLHENSCDNFSSPFFRFSGCFLCCVFSSSHSLWQLDVGIFTIPLYSCAGFSLA